MMTICRLIALTIALAFAQSCAHKHGHDHDHKHDKKHKHDDHDHDHDHDHGKDHDHDHDHGKDHDHDHHSHKHAVKTIGKTDWAVVKKITLAPGQTTGWHSGPGRLIVALSDYKIKYEEKGQKDRFKTWHMGDVHWHGAGEHNVTNIGKTQAEFLKVIRTGKLSGIKKSWADKHNHSQFHKNIFENEWAEVSKVTLKSGQRQKAHEGSYRVIISTSDYEISFAEKGKKTIKRHFHFGDAHFHTPGVHYVTNIGKSEAKFVVVNYKK